MARLEPERGRRIIAIVALAAAFLTAAMSLGAILRTGTDNLPTQLFRLVATGFLGAFAYAGYGWARGLLAAWLGFIGVTFLLASGLIARSTLEAGLVFLLAAVYFALAIALLGFHSVHDYIEARTSERERANRSRSRPPV